MPSEPDSHTQARDIATRKMREIRSLKACPGWQGWMLPGLQQIRADLHATIISGRCTSFEEYQAKTTFLAELDAKVFKPLEEDEARHLATLNQLEVHSSP
jgi:hypothetical protein